MISLSGHECKDCPKECSIRGIDEFLEGHDVNAVVNGLGDAGQMIIDAHLRVCPEMMIVMGEILSIARECMAVGYFKGRTYPQIPKAFTE